MVAVCIIPLQACSIEHLPMTLQPSLRERADVLDELVFRDPLLVIGHHRLSNRRHNLSSQFRIHSYAIRVMVTPVCPFSGFGSPMMALNSR